MRFFNADPLSEEYAYQSHYNFSENSVVNSRELEGLERVIVLGRDATAAGAAGVAARGRSTAKLTPDWVDNYVKDVNHTNDMITSFGITMAFVAKDKIEKFADRVLNSERILKVKKTRAVKPNPSLKTKIKIQKLKRKV